jgi:osmotically-inducible protein OsmY
MLAGLTAGALASTALADGSGKSAADNSAKNQPIEAANKPTADDQSNAKSDVELAAQIRRAIVEDESLSTYAHNVKVITKDGRVTLSGPVKNEAERLTITSIAQKFAGAGTVTSNLEIAH